MPRCVNCDVRIPSKNAMCCNCWSNTLSSKKRMYMYAKIQKTDS